LPVLEQVEVGSMADPDSLPGLAHFTEHMLFYASEKYPKEDEYSKWVADHGGHTNAWTSAENTNYQFTVNWDHLPSTLDRFAQVSNLSADTRVEIWV
jgi:insulysin